MKTLAILLTSEEYLPQIGGAEICVRNLRKEYERLGHRVTIFTNMLEEAADDAGCVVRVPWRWRPLPLLRNVVALWKLIGKCDVVHAQYSYRLGYLASIIARLGRKPMVLTQQGRGIVPEVRPKWHHALLATLCRRGSQRHASRVTATSEELAALSQPYVARSRVLMISNGYDARVFTPNAALAYPVEFQTLPGGVCVLLTVRRLVPKNGIHILVQALALVKEVNPHFHYFAIGEGRARSLIERLIREHDLTSHVTLLGSRSNDDLPPYYQHSDLVLVPSSAEARSIACIEAMGMGKPIIASRVGGLINLLGEHGEYGTLVPIYDSEACTYDAPTVLSRERLQKLAGAILAFLHDPHPFREKAKRAREVAERQYSWASVAAQYLGLYDSLLSRVRSI